MQTITSTDAAQVRPGEPCPPCKDGDHATVEDEICTCCGQTGVVE